MTFYGRYLFFKAHAGYATPPGAAACARDLARAEEWRERMEAEGRLTVEWVPDEYVGADDYDGPPPADGFWGCVLTLDGECVASLWGIDVAPPHPYCRVVEAQLASEAAYLDAERAARAVPPL